MHQWPVKAPLTLGDRAMLARRHSDRDACVGTHRGRLRVAPSQLEADTQLVNQFSKDACSIEEHVTSRLDAAAPAAVVCAVWTAAADARCRSTCRSGKLQQCKCASMGRHDKTDKWLTRVYRSKQAMLQDVMWATGNAQPCARTCRNLALQLSANVPARRLGERARNLHMRATYRHSE